MARQRFIWPQIWDDPDLGRCSLEARLLYIACFSLADDEGRLIGDPDYLKSAAFRYASGRKVSRSRIKAARSELADVCESFCIYAVNGTEYIAFRNWSKFQKPKYPSPSRFPAPPWDSGNRSGNESGNSTRNRSGRGSGSIPPRDGLGRDKPPSFLPTSTSDVDGRTEPDQAGDDEPNPLAHLNLANVLKDIPA